VTEPDWRDRQMRTSYLHLTVRLLAFECFGPTIFATSVLEDSKPERHLLETNRARISSGCLSLISGARHGSGKITDTTV
jgi:hypothetical protein